MKLISLKYRVYYNSQNNSLIMLEFDFSWVIVRRYLFCGRFSKLSGFKYAAFLNACIMLAMNFIFILQIHILLISYNKVYIRSR